VSARLSPDPALRADLRRCEELARAHYENFAVGSLLMPRRLRAPLAACYAVMRIADDFADEGAGPEVAAKQLREWEAGLERAARGEPVEHFALRAGGAVIRAFALELDDFRALFRAFLRDTRETRCATFEDLLDYCRDSANPVGRIVLGLFGARAGAGSDDDALLRGSDAICTGLQLANHWQDVAEDAQRGRIYLPLEDLRRFGVDPESVMRGEDSPGLRACLALEVERARAFLAEGRSLVERARGRLRVEVALFRRAGLAACAAVERAGYAVMAGAPRLGARDRCAVLALGFGDAFSAAREARRGR
jgi:squalene synthase HpnC